MTVHLVGAGPGDPGLLTVRALEVLRRAAEDALTFGFVSAVFDDEVLQREALSRAERLAGLPPESVRTTKALMRDAFRNVLPEQMRRESERFAERLRSAEAREVMSHFFEGRSG